MASVRLVKKTEQRKALRQLVDAIPVLLAELAKRDEFRDAIPELQKCREDAETLLVKGFVQADLTRLGNEFRPVIRTHQHWMPPLEERDGRWLEPTWFRALDEAHDRVMRVANSLRVIGDY